MNENVIPIEEFIPPSREQLEKQAREFYRTHRKKAYRELKKSSELQKCAG
jgi:hypothetical protein